jgi:hypothetical protein
MPSGLAGAAMCRFPFRIVYVCAIGLAVLVAAAFSNCVSAAEITCRSIFGRPDTAPCIAALLKGVIEPGDSAKFAAFLHANHPSHRGFRL